MRPAWLPHPLLIRPDKLHNDPSQKKENRSCISITADQPQQVHSQQIAQDPHEQKQMQQNQGKIEIVAVGNHFSCQGGDDNGRVCKNHTEYKPHKEDVQNRIIEGRSEEHTSELQSRGHLVCRLLLEKKKA